MSDFGVLLDSQSVRFERLLPHPIERVWAYLTDAALRARWLASGEMDIQTGGALRLTFRNPPIGGRADGTASDEAQLEDYTFTGRVLRCEEPCILSHTWDEKDGTESEVTYELAHDGDCTRLTVTHRRLSDASLRTDVAAGWHTHLNALEDVLLGRSPPPFWDAHAKFKEHYASQEP